jgi:membrane protease YdiL (CAAX protease family)
MNKFPDLIKNQPFDIMASSGVQVMYIKLIPMIIIILMIASIFAAIEEIVFRGYIFGELLSKFRSRLAANALQSLLFVLYFFFNGYGKLSVSNAIQLLELFLFGLFLGWLRLRYRSLGMTWIIRTMYYAGLMYAPHLVAYALQTFTV